MLSFWGTIAPIRRQSTEWHLLAAGHRVTLVRGTVMVRSYHLLVRWLFLAGMVLALLEVAYDLLGHPAVVATGSDAILYLALFALAICSYSWFAIFQTRAA